MAKTKTNKIKIDGELTFESLDLNAARLSLSENENIMYGGKLNVPASVIRKAAKPGEFDPSFVEVTGTYEFNISVKRKG